MPSLSNLYWTFFVFVAALVSFHVYIYVARPNARFLKKIDYWWLGFSALSLVSAAASQRQMISGNSLTYSSQRDLFQASYAASFAEGQRKYVCGTPWQAPLPPQGAPMDRYNSRHLACDYFTTIASRLNAPGVDLVSSVRSFVMPALPAALAEGWSNALLVKVVDQVQTIIVEDDRLLLDTKRSALDWRTAPLK